MAGFHPDPDRFITFDCSGLTGWAWGDSDRLHKSGTWKLPKDVRRSAALNRFRQWATEMITVNRCGKVFFEQPIMPHARGEVNARGKVEIQQNTSLDAMVALLGYAIVIGLICDDLGIECVPYPMQSWRSELGVPTMCPPKVKVHLPKTSDAGRKWVKQQTILKIRSLGHNPSGDDEADAIGIFEAVRMRRARKTSQPGFPELARFDDEVVP